jgi:ATP-dependent helicase HrpB
MLNGSKAFSTQEDGARRMRVPFKGESAGAVTPGQLPVEPLLPALLDALEHAGSAVLVAPPGAGKTTAVPLALLEAPWLQSRRILLLEPRRLAARRAAWHMAERLNEGEPGGTVGYRTRQETRVGPSTRIEVVTEGVLTRMIQADPALEGVGAVLFDEFHERSLHADLGLALALEARDLFAPELRILVLSATLDPEPVAALLARSTDGGSTSGGRTGGDAPILRSEGRMYPIETQWKRPERRSGGGGPYDGAMSDVAATVLRALDETEGDVLVFLPGAREIHQAQRLLSGRVSEAVTLTMLHGTLTREAQDQALRPAPRGRRKVILSSAVAETSLTIEGVRVVVDSGWMRIPRFDPGSGLTRLRTVRVSRDAADQRRGRAGRTAPGWCYRVWTEAEDRGLVPHRTPEILEADLAPLLLEVARWGVRPEALRWLTPPSAAALASAARLLRSLGLMRADGTLTPAGEHAAGLGTHPRIARLLQAASDLEVPALGFAMAALLEDRDPMLRADGGGIPDVDVRLRIEALELGRSPVAGVRMDPGGLDRARTQMRKLARTLGTHPTRERLPLDDAGVLAARGWPDRIARVQQGARYLLANGKGATLEGAQPLVGTPWLVAIEVDDRGGDLRILQAAPLDPSAFEGTLADVVEVSEAVLWNRESGRVEADRVHRIGAVELMRSPLPDPDPVAVAAQLAEGVRDAGLHALPWTPESRHLRGRIAFMRRLDVQEPVWPDVSDEGLLETLETWLLPHAQGVRSLEALRKRVDLGEALLTGVSWEARQRMERWAPTHLQVPSGSRIPVSYEDPEAPVLAVRLQEVFGLRETPRVAEGRVPLTIHLLSPAHRPVQVTRDLESFWRDAYFEVRKDLRGRYPKHFWPDDPLSAAPTHRARPRPR